MLWKTGVMNKNKSMVVVIGDIILDKYITGNCERLSPEAPVPILKAQEEQYFLGGAANVASNITKLGKEIALVSIIGDDENSRKTLELCETYKIKQEWLIKKVNREIPLKTRLMSNNQQMLRYDNEKIQPLSKSDEQEMMNNLTKILDQFIVETLVISDYNKGTLSNNLIKQIVDISKKNDIFTRRLSL